MDERHNPWKILSEKVMYDNPWMKVTQYDVINPSGGKGIYGKVHFKHWGTGILALDQQNNTYLVGQYRFTLNQYSWEIPEGGCLIGNDPLEAAKRELKEETGLIANQWIHILDFNLTNSIGDEFAKIYLARDLALGNASPEDTEQLAMKKVPFEEAYQMVEKGEITDSISVAAILKVKLMLLDGRIS